MLDTTTLAPGRKYRHYNGGVYTLLHIAIHTDNKRLMIVYEAADGQIWCRPATQFLQQVNNTSLRFTPVPE